MYNPKETKAMKEQKQKQKQMIKEEEDVEVVDNSKDVSDSKIFPQRLMDILNDPANEDSIVWHPNGKLFTIINRHKFSKEVLPKYFRKTKYASFTRKLHRWNFTRLTRGRQQSTYYHEFFQRGKENICTQMYCNNDRAKFAVSRKVAANNVDDKADTTNSSSIFPLQQQQQEPKDEQRNAILAAMTANAAVHRATTPNVQLSRPPQQSLCEPNTFLAQKLLAASLIDLSDKAPKVTTSGKKYPSSSLPLSTSDQVRLLRRELQVKATLLQEQEIKLKNELIIQQQNELLKRQRDQLLFKAQHERLLLNQYQEKQLSLSLIGKTIPVFGQNTAQSHELLKQQRALEKEASRLRLQLTLMKLDSSVAPAAPSITKYRASAA